MTCCGVGGTVTPAIVFQVLGANVFLVVDFARTHPAFGGPAATAALASAGLAYFGFIAHLVACGWTLAAKPDAASLATALHGGGSGNGRTGGARVGVETRLPPVPFSGPSQEPAQSHERTEACREERIQL